MGRLFAGHGLLAIGGLFGRRRLFALGRLLSRHRLFADRLLAALLLALRLFALGGCCLLLRLKRFGLRDRLTGGRCLLGRRLLGGRGFDLLILLALLALGLLVVVVCRGGLLDRLFGRCGLLLLVALFPARLDRLLFVCRSRLFGGLFGRRGLDLLLLVALFPARLDRLLFVCRGRLLGGLFGRCGLDLLLLVTFLPARQLLLSGRRGLFDRSLFGLLLLITLLPARLLLLLALRRRSLLRWRGFCLLLLVALLSLGLFRLPLLFLRAGLC
ncbi:hypothetical protein [Mesorhizobium amorphae]|uniref:Uncharacterized protein n=1 Tax=Mesorhizobium amorphae CCNWGS0123 TaxID=1082933 RepID=G6YK42_9HYPH|nr:hypothetical protein MEA186_31881 [Mesorhizobium amorphae CCNWGS0123]